MLNDTEANTKQFAGEYEHVDNMNNIEPIDHKNEERSPSIESGKSFDQNQNYFYRCHFNHQIETGQNHHQ